jgi:DNA-binding IclR family transcriptional regulator
MTHREQSLAVLVALLDLVRAGLPASVSRLAGRLGMQVADTEAALARLATVGLVVDGPRLTMTGLALSTSLAAERDRGAAHLDRRAA